MILIAQSFRFYSQRQAFALRIFPLSSEPKHINRYPHSVFYRCVEGEQTTVRHRSKSDVARLSQACRDLAVRRWGS